MRALAAALAVAVAAAAAAQGADWVLVSPSPRAVAGERFHLTAIAPEGETLPEEISVTVRSDIAEVLVSMQAQGPAERGRRSYAGLLPEAAAGTATVSLSAPGPSNALALLVARRDAPEAPAAEEEAPLSRNDPIYFVFGTRGGNTARFQVSFKYRLFDLESGYGRAQPWLSALYFAYTQNSVWDLSSRSKPFRDTSYRPSLFWRWQRTDEKTWIDEARLGFEHESNGREGALSRSLNTLFARPQWDFALGEGKLEFTPRLNAYIDKEENPDIHRYRGYVDWRVRYDTGGFWIATAVARYGTAGKGSLLLDLSRQTRDLRLGPVSGYLHVQFFAGYGEDIVDYNVRRKSQLRLGFAIVP